MNKDPKPFLQHILESIEWIERYIGRVSKEEFTKEMQIQDSVIRRLEIIGEATKNLPENLRGQFLEIPWNNIAGMRDVLIHEYFAVDTEMVWNTVKNDLPSFKKKVQEILSNIPENYSNRS